MADLSWYWHRLQAMSPLEIARHAQKKLRQAADARRSFPAQPAVFEHPQAYPQLPAANSAPQVLQEALRKDADDILAGHWLAFGHLTLQVDTPPHWQTDYLVGRDIATPQSAFGLNHRSLPDGADIRVVWELNRWHQLARLAMAAYVLGAEEPGAKCIAWLEDWHRHNPPYQGWNWTSGLEAGLRLIQFTWLDALLTQWPHHARIKHSLDNLRAQLLPAHAWYAWRHRSFGSSANNHLLGELAGLILAVVRWPNLSKWSTSLHHLQACWQKEVLKQFAEDGGTREQALGYQLFAWELCWHTRAALKSAGAAVSEQVEERLEQALCFFWEVQSRGEHWDYGDSDDGAVLPLWLSVSQRVSEWRSWAAGEDSSAGLTYWLGQTAPAKDPRLGWGTPRKAQQRSGWWIYPQTGIALHESGFWWLRWDLSPLGYLSTAAHGHLDALHLSIWYHGIPLIIDPGTGAYFAEPELRTWLASREAHNGPCSLPFDKIRRVGPFLWSALHSTALWKPTGDQSLRAECLEYSREISHLSPEGWEVADRPSAAETEGLPFVVRWQFAPGVWVKQISERKYSIRRADVTVMLEADENWHKVELGEPLASANEQPGARQGQGLSEGLVSPAFRQVLRAPYLKLLAHPKPGQPCVFRTRFLACPAA